jgi:hypothetical protein
MTQRHVSISVDMGSDVNVNAEVKKMKLRMIEGDDYAFCPR